MRFTNNSLRVPLWHRTLAWALLAVMTLVLAACGSGNKTAESGTGGGAAGKTDAPKPPIKVAFLAPTTGTAAAAGMATVHHVMVLEPALWVAYSGESDHSVR